MNNEPQYPLNNGEDIINITEHSNKLSKNSRNSRKNKKDKKNNKNSSTIRIAMIASGFIILLLASFFVYQYVSFQRYISNRIAQAEDAKGKISDTLGRMNDLKLNEASKEVRPEPEKIMLEDFPVIARINIPSIDIDYPIVTLTDEQMKVQDIDERYRRALELAIVKYDGVDPNQVGNMIVMGHDYRDLSMFGKLKNIKVGDTFTVTDMYGHTYNYKVDDIFDAHRSNDIPKVVDQNTAGKTVVTMFTCTNDPLVRLCVRGTKIN